MKKIIRKTVQEKIAASRLHELTISAYSKEMRLNLNGTKVLAKHLKGKEYDFFNIYYDKDKGVLSIKFDKKGSFHFKRYKNRQERRSYINDLFESGYTLPEIENTVWHHKDSRLFTLKRNKNNFYTLELCKN